MSVHNEQVASVLRRAVQEILGRGLADPRVKGMISVTRVAVSPDGMNATIYVSIMPEEREAVTMHGLRSASKYVRSQLAGKVEMRRVPQLSFKLDESLKKQSAVLGAIEEAKARSIELPEDGADAREDDGTMMEPGTRSESESQ